MQLNAVFRGACGHELVFSGPSWSALDKTFWMWVMIERYASRVCRHGRGTNYKLIAGRAMNTRIHICYLVSALVDYGTLFCQPKESRAKLTVYMKVVEVLLGPYITLNTWYTDPQCPRCCNWLICCGSFVLAAGRKIIGGCCQPAAGKQPSAGGRDTTPGHLQVLSSATHISYVRHPLFQDIIPGEPFGALAAFL